MSRSNRKAAERIGIRLTGLENETTKVMLEPWGDKVLLRKGGLLEISGEGPPGDALELCFSKRDIVIYGWPGSELTTSVFDWAQEAHSDRAEMPSTASSHDVRLTNQGSKRMTLNLHYWVQASVPKATGFAIEIASKRATYGLPSKKSLTLHLYKAAPNFLDIEARESQVTVRGLIDTISVTQNGKPIEPEELVDEPPAMLGLPPKRNFRISSRQIRRR